MVSIESSVKSSMKAALHGIIKYRQFLDSNYFEYTFSDSSFKFVYDSVGEYLYFRDKGIKNGMSAEGIPIKFFDRSPNCDYVVDIGAHYGYYSVILGVLNPEATLICFEPSKRNREILARNLAANSLDAELKGDVVSGEDKEVKFYENTDRSMSQTFGTVMPDTDESYSEVDKKAVSPSTFLPNDVDSIFLKIDAEGEEYGILEKLLSLDYLESVSGVVELHPSKAPLEDDLDPQIRNLFNDYEIKFEFLGDSVEDYKHDYPLYYFTNR